MNASDAPIKLNGFKPLQLIATPLMRLARNKAKGEVTIQQMWVDQATGDEHWRDLPMVDVDDAPKVLRA